MEILVKWKLFCLLLFLGWEAWIDSKEKYIAVREVVIFGILGIVFSVYLDGKGMFFAVLTGSIPGILTLMASKFTNEAIGYGDGLLILVCGCYLGGVIAAGLFLMALFICIPYVMLLFILGKARGKTEIAFGPFLLTAYVCWIGMSMNGNM